MAENEKIMHYANFNITYGAEEQPMLEHFEDIVFPAFLSGFRRGKSDEYPAFYFDGIDIKELDGQYVLVGNYIKDTQYNIRTTIHDGKLVSTPADVPTAPYSRFIIFLKNHRMLLVRNEAQSPDIRSFQATVRGMLNNYIREENHNKDKDHKLPHALVNIVDIPLKSTIEDLLKSVQKVNWLKFRFFPLNNDKNPLIFAEGIDREMKSIQSKHAHVQFTSPESKEEIVTLIDQSSGLALATLEVRDSEGNKTKIKEEQFTTSTKISFGRDIIAEDDQYIIIQAKKDSAITVQSEENEILYERFLAVIKKLKG
ncbi:MAG: hypothetical protein RR313_08000 [Anaerovoracaceae bacterium]